MKKSKTEIIKEATEYAIHKYGFNYPALNEAISDIIRKRRFSEVTAADCMEKMEKTTKAQIKKAM